MIGSGPVVRTWGPVSDTSAFEAGSVTKTVTGLLLALAIETGEVSGSDRLDRFLPGTGRAGQATLAELATHTSGLPRLPASTLLRALAHPGDPYRGSSVPRLIRDTRRVRPGRPAELLTAIWAWPCSGTRSRPRRPRRSGISPGIGYSCRWA
jgi:CubicO group peptidase (beta-lactamase class C family)